MKKHRVHLEIGFSQVVEDPKFALRFKEDIISYRWPFPSWKARGAPKDWPEQMHIARFYDDEWLDIIRKVSRSRYVSFTDRRTGDTNAVLVTSRAPAVIEQVLSFCDVILDEAGAAVSKPATN